MAKSFRNLWPKFISWDNLLLAYRRCRRRKRYKPAAVRFQFQWEEELLRLQQELKTDAWVPGAYYNFRITDPKPRVISAAPFRDRIVHHAIVNVLEPLYERRFVFDSYACRQGKGTHRAIRRAQHYMQRFPYVLKTDIVRFFPTVDHEVLASLLRKQIRDDRLMSIICRVINSSSDLQDGDCQPHWFPGDGLLDVLRAKGIPIGNLTNQFFANVLLDPIDHFIKEVLQVGGYVRYADDLLLFASSKDELWAFADAIRARLNEDRLSLHPEKTVVHRCCDGVTFLGFQVTPSELRLTQQSIRRFNQRRRRLVFEFANGETNLASIRQSLQAWSSHIQQANAAAIGKQLLSRWRLSRRRSIALCLEEPHNHESGD